MPVDATCVRLVQITIPAGKRETILQALEDEGVEYVVSDETSGRKFSAIAYVPLPNEAVQPILDALHDAGLSDEAYTVILDANTVVSKRFEELKERYEQEEDTENRISREELRAAATELAPSTATFVAMTIISALIATAGLLLDSPAVVVGSMVIAPLIGPAMAASVGTVINEQDLFRRGLRLQIGGLILAVIAAAAFAALVRYAHLTPPIADIFTVPEIEERVAPDVLSLIVALGAGAAGVIALTSGVSTALVGVMIAVALLPPAAAVGIGIAWMDPLTTLGSAVLLLVNVISINLAAILVLWYSGYRPKHWFHMGDAKMDTLKRVSVLVVAILVLSVFLGGVTYDTFQRATAEEEIRNDIAELIETTDASTEYDVSLLELDIEYTNTALFRRTNQITAVVGLPPGEEVGGIATDIERIASSVTGRDVDVEVRFVGMDRA